MNGVLDIEVNGSFLDLPTASMRYELVNSIFSTDGHQDNYSFPLELPFTQRNNLVFKYANQVDTTERVTDYTATIYVFGCPKFKCRLKVSRGKRNSYSVVLTSGIKSLRSASMKLADIPMGNDFTLGNSQASVLATCKAAGLESDWSVYGFTFVPFYCQNFYNGLNASFQGVVNRVNSTTGNLLGNSATLVNNKYVHVPWLFLFHILNKIFEYESLGPTGTFWEDPEYAKLLITNLRAIEIRPPNLNTYVRSDVDQDFTATGQKVAMTVGAPGTYDFPNAWDGASNEYVIRNAGQHNIEIYMNTEGRSAATVPPPYINAGWFDVYYDGTKVKTIIVNDKGVGSHPFYASLSITAGGGDIGKTIYIEHRHSPSSEQSATYTRMHSCLMKVLVDTASPPSQSASTLLFKNHVPDMTVGELLAQLMSRGVTMDFDFAAGTARLDIADRALRFPDAITLTDKAVIERDFSFEESGKGIEVSYEIPDEDVSISDIDSNLLQMEFDGVDFSSIVPAQEGSLLLIRATNEILHGAPGSGGMLEWKFHKHYNPPYKLGNGETKISLRLPPVMMCVATNEGGSADQNMAVMPWIGGIGNSELYGLGIKNPHTPRLVFYRGPNTVGPADVQRGGSYVLASSEIYGVNGNITGDYTLRLDKAHSMLRMNRGKHLEILNRSEILEQEFTIDSLLLEKLTPSAKFIVDWNLFIAKTISLLIDKNKAQGRAFLYKV